jgi:heme A synthase
MTPFARVFSGALGVFFLGLGVAILGTSADRTWQPVLAALAVLVLGLDFLLGAIRSRWPRLALALQLP